MRRRHFLKTASVGAALPLANAAFPVMSLGAPLFTVAGSDPSERVLVLINLIGGNDGLSSVVPLEAFADLMAVRGNITIPESRLLSLDSTRALHPSLTGLRDVWEQGRLNILQGVGYPDQNGSHFRSSDIWSTASPADVVYDTGWLGRHFDGQHPGFPSGYPSGDHPDPIAISVGSSASETCQGLAGNFSLTVQDPDTATSILDTAGGTVPDRLYGDELRFIRQTISQSNAYASRVAAASQAARNQVTYPADNTLALHLSYVARMIAGGLRTKVYVVSLGGFDTHAGQVVSGSPETGVHANLLRQLGDAVAAFQSDIRALGLDERVVGMTFSEFGRRIRSNGAHGTDHGAAAPQFIFGGCVNAGVIGEDPTVDRQVDEQESLPMQFDFRDMYGSVLQDWFGVEAATVRSLLHEQYTHIPILRNCSTPTSTEELPNRDTRLALWPSVFQHSTSIRFSKSTAGATGLSVFDARGALVEQLFDRRLPAGEHTVQFLADRCPPGVLFFRLQEGASVRTVRGVKV